MVFRPVPLKPLRVSNGARFDAPLPLMLCVLTTPVPLRAPELIDTVGFSGRPLSNVPVAPTWKPCR
jgi:hypothetical protein